MHLGVIAAGDGLRLKEEGIKEPKPLIKVQGKTLLERIFTITEKYKFKSCNIIVNEKFKKDVENFFLSKVPKIEFNIIYKSTPSSLHSLYQLKQYLSDDSFCLMTIDSIFSESEFENFLEEVKKNEIYDGLIAITDFVDDEKPLWVKIDRNNKIKRFSSNREDSNYITGGIYFFRKGVIEYTEKALVDNISRLRNFLQYLIETDLKLKAIKFSKIIDIDHKKDLVEAEKFLELIEKPV